ncbi:hypothetical protein HP467_07150 [Curtobacterium albidum]|uniref:Uncharacterized protein n=1 Tax=Curtobacterium citreum TaxID=2036 RepID=A0A850DTP1_9MICO|nr:hypothetical protein [Curtobacterium albidum]NUU27888.1 hypothetical protein [Curtobacterium albidum]
MTEAARILFVVAALAELAGVLLIVADITRARRLLRSRLNRTIDGGDASTKFDELTVAETSDPVELFLLEGRSGQVLAVILLAIGIITGAVGNFLTL